MLSSRAGIRYPPFVTKLALALLLLAGTLGGCGTTYSGLAMRDSDDKAAAVYADCDQQLRAGKLRSYREAVLCAQPKVRQAYLENAYPYMDLVDFELEARMTGAEAIDAGTAKAADVARDVAELERRILAERERRIETTSTIAGNPTRMPADQMLAGLSTLQGRQLPPATATCFSVGSFTHCN